MTKLIKWVALFIASTFLLNLNANAKTFSIGVSQEVDTLNPIFSTMLVGNYVHGATNRVLNLYTKNNKWEEQLAKATPSLDNGGAKIVGKGKKKRIVATWEFKKDAKWSDGTPLTGHDIAFSWKAAIYPKIAATDRDAYESIESIVVDKKNPKKFVVTYKDLRWDFNRMSLIKILPKHLEESIFNKYKDQPDGYAKNSLYSQKPTTPGLYNGPYVVSEFKIGSHIKLTRNPHFYGKKPSLDTVVIKLIPNTATMEANLRSGNIDMIASIGLSFDQALALDKKTKSGKLPFDVNFQPSLTYEHIELNQVKDKQLQDINVRKALVHAINRDDLVKALFNNRQIKAIHTFAPSDPRYTEDKKIVKHYSYSPRKAKKLLKKAGYQKNKDGYFYKDGKKLSLTIKSTAGNKVRELVQVFLQDAYKKVGVELLIKNEPARVLFGQSGPKLKYGSMIMFAWTFMPDASMKNFFHSRFIPSKKNGFSGNNWNGWKNKRVDQIVTDWEVEFDKKKRNALTRELITYYTDEVPVIPLYYRSDVSVTPKGFKGYKLSSNLFQATNHIEDWKL